MRFPWFRENLREAEKNVWRIFCGRTGLGRAFGAIKTPVQKLLPNRCLGLPREQETKLTLFPWFRENLREAEKIPRSQRARWRDTPHPQRRRFRVPYLHASPSRGEGKIQALHQ
jgi:hypothetical protein